MTVRELDRTPNLALLYAKAAVTGPLGGGEELPETELRLGDVAVDRDHLAQYARVCGFGLRDTLPVTYPHIVSFPLAVEIMADRSFPFSLPGLVHVANTITKHREIRVEEPLTVSVRTEDLRPHSKGRQFDVVSEVRVEDELVWNEASTYLRKGGGPDDSEGGSRGERLTFDPPEEDERNAVWSIASDTGRRYAAVSGDRNPIHLHPLTARLFGFPKPIAHGMWTKARCLAAFEGRLPEAFTTQVSFKKPLMLPSKVAFASDHRDGAWTFALRDAKKGLPHVLGEVRPT